MLVAKSKGSEPTTVPTSHHPSKTLPGASQHPSKTLAKSHVCHLMLTTLMFIHTNKLRSYFHTRNLLKPVPCHYFRPNNVLLPVPSNWNLSSFAACSSFVFWLDHTHVICTIPYYHLNVKEKPRKYKYSWFSTHEYVLGPKVGTNMTLHRSYLISMPHKW